MLFHELDKVGNGLLDPHELGRSRCPILLASPFSAPIPGPKGHFEAHVNKDFRVILCGHREGAIEDMKLHNPIESSPKESGLVFEDFF
jgi:hypothetical protein